jgi:hypothetical protein
MDPSDLVSIIDTANQSVKQTDWFWNASKEDRELYKQYYSKKNARANTAKAPTVIAEEDEAREEENEDDDNGQEEDEETEQAGSADEVLDVGAAASPDTTAPVPPKRERSAAQKRYQDYLTIAREELTKQGKKPISMSECHTLCKQMLEEDGWR